MTIVRLSDLVHQLPCLVISLPWLHTCPSTHISLMEYLALCSLVIIFPRILLFLVLRDLIAVYELARNATHEFSLSRSQQMAQISAMWPFFKSNTLRSLQVFLIQCLRGYKKMPGHLAKCFNLQNKFLRHSCSSPVSHILIVIYFKHHITFIY